MITINNVANTWLIPSYNRNAVSTYLLNELVIINRLGDEVYRKKNYRGDWTADELAAGVYYYWLYVQRDQREYKGWIQILR